MSTVETEDSPRLLRSSATVSLFTMLSRVMGLARDTVVARYIGAGLDADVFNISFALSNFFRRLFAEGAFSQAFVPVLAEYKTNGSRAAAKEFVDRIAGCLGTSLFLLTSLAVIGAPAVAAVYAFGFLDDEEKFGLTVRFIRITFPYLFLISLTGLAGAILNSYGRFAVPAITPVLLNITLIIAAVVISPLMDPPALALAWGVLISGVVQLLFQLPFLMRLQMMPKPVMDWRHPGVRKVLFLMLPAMFGVSVSQINLLLDSILATLLPTGSPTWLKFSDRMSELPLGVFAIAIATVILPSLSRLYSDKKVDQFSKTLSWALRLVFLIGIPASVALLILAEPILATLFQYGKWTPRDTAMASLSMRAYAIGLLAFMLIKVLAPGFFARQNTKTPMKIGVVAMVSNMVMNIVFVFPLKSIDIGHMGLALATSLAAFINAGLLFRYLRKHGAYHPQAGWLLFWSKLAVAGIVMAIVLLTLGLQWNSWDAWQWYQRGFYLSVICIAGMGAYIGTLALLGFRARHFYPPR